MYTWKHPLYALLGLSLLLFSNSCTKKHIATPSYLQSFAKEYKQSPRQTNLEWFKDAKYGMFIHYGLYSLLEKDAWAQVKDTIPVVEYDKLKHRFTAERFDANQITDLAIAGGMKYITITSKHHDGFSLFDSKAGEFNAVNSAAKRDLIKELYDACQKKGLALFLYYSYASDWRHPYFYTRDVGWKFGQPAYQEPQPEYLFKKDEDFKKYVDFVHQQLTELFTQYPNIAGIWFDPVMGFYQRPDLFPLDDTYALIRKLSPHALISFKQGASGDEDFRAPERGTGSVKGFEGIQVAQMAIEKNKDKPSEICNTLQPHGWSYNKADDGKHKTADEVIQLLKDAKAANANLLLNIGPKGDGSIPDEDVKTLTEAGKRLAEVFSKP